MKEYFVMVDSSDKPVGQQMAAFNKRAEFLFENRTGIKAKALTMYQFSLTLQHQNTPELEVK